jgi:hypothetical protein
VDQLAEANRMFATVNRDEDGDEVRPRRMPAEAELAAFFR